MRIFLFVRFLFIDTIGHGIRIPSVYVETINKCLFAPKPLFFGFVDTATYDCNN